MKNKKLRAQVSAQNDQPAGPSDQHAHAEPASNISCPETAATVHPPGNPIIHHQQLPCCDTKLISGRLQLTHPSERCGGEVVTSVVSLPAEASPTKASMAVAIIDRKRFAQRLRQKLRLEQAYWQAKGIEFRIITD